MSTSAFARFSDLEARPLKMADVDAVTALVASCELADDGVVEIDRDDIVSDWQRPGFDLQRDSVGLFRGDTLVAAAEVFRGRRAEANVHPDHRGRGIGAALLAWTEQTARAAGSDRVSQTVTDANSAAAELFARHGYAYGHTSWILGIVHDEPPPQPVLPDGVDFRDFVPGRDDHAVYTVVEDAFNEWPGRDPLTFPDWAATTIRRPRFEPWHVLLAVEVDTGAIVGVALLVDYGPEGGWVHQVATRATHRHRGIARALLMRAFGAFFERGTRHCGLSTDSRTGALGLYERVGMTVTRSYTNRVKDLTTG